MVFATFIAFIDKSIAVAVHFGLSFNKETTIQPDPVPMSNIFFYLSFGKKFKVSSIINSVSGLGIKTYLLVINLYFQKYL